MIVYPGFGIRPRSSATEVARARAHTHTHTQRQHFFFFLKVYFCSKRFYVTIFLFCDFFVCFYVLRFFCLGYLITYFIGFFPLFLVFLSNGITEINQVAISYCTEL